MPATPTLSLVAAGCVVVCRGSLIICYDSAASVRLVLLIATTIKEEEDCCRFLLQLPGPLKGSGLQGYGSAFSGLYLFKA